MIDFQTRMKEISDRVIKALNTRHASATALHVAHWMPPEAYEAEQQFKTHALDDMLWLLQKYNELVAENRTLNTKLDFYRAKDD